MASYERREMPYKKCTFQKMGTKKHQLKGNRKDPKRRDRIIKKMSNIKE